MAERPYTVLSCCVSLDGYLDDASERRLVLSNAADLDRVDGLRAECDAILVGAATVRNDDPRLLVHSAERRRARLRRGLPPNPVKVTLTDHAKLDPAARFFTAGDADRLVYCTTAAAEEARRTLGGLARFVDAGESVRMPWLCHDLHVRGVRRLLVEGGGAVLTQFLIEGIADELQLAVAPIFVGDPAGTRFVEAGAFPWCGDRRARLVETRPVGDVVLLRYALSERFRTDSEETT
jgi:5-amino-6-(5-phosphoribosylamino)uracil reductase